MTKQEVIKILKLIKSTVFLGNRKFLDALDRAIELLAQPEPCEDTISRKAAIDATWKDPFYTDPLNVLSEVRDRIKTLPSAQPSFSRDQENDHSAEYSKKVVPCDDAVSRQAAIDAAIEAVDEWDGGCNLTRADMIADAINNTLPSARLEQRWIPCSKTVDIPDREIMACDRNGHLIFGYLVYEDDQWLCVSDSEMMYDPIAWGEKPEPWKGEGNEK